MELYSRGERREGGVVDLGKYSDPGLTSWQQTKRNM